MHDCPIRTQALRTPYAPALIDAGGALSYAALDRRIAGAARWLSAQGLHAGDRVALSFPPGALVQALLFAALRLGVVACPIDPRFPAAYRAKLTQRLRCEAIIGGGTEWRGCRRIAAPNLESRHLKSPFQGGFSGMLISHTTPIEKKDAHRGGIIVWTSGSSADPKAALLRPENFCASARQANAALEFGPSSRWLLSLSPHHVAGLGILFRCAVAGAAMVLPAPHAPIAEAIVRHGVTHVSLVPAQLRRLMDEHPGALGGLACILLGGGPMAPQVIEQARRAGLPVVTSYGMTETCGLIATDRPLLPGTLRISLEGEILVRGEAVFAGYAQNYGHRNALDDAGWFHTGDLGSIDAEGRLQVTGRLGTRFICGGENVHPEEVERCLRTLPGIRDAVVVPVPDSKFGAVPAAFLDWDDDEVPDFAWLKAELYKNLPRFKVPRHFLPWPGGGGGALQKPDRPSLIRLATRLCGGAESQKTTAFGGVGTGHE